MRRGGRGFSLVELMIAMAIFVTAYLAIIGIFPSCARAVHQSRVIALATHVAQRQLEDAVSATGGFASIVNANGTVPVISVINNNTETLNFQWTITVTNPGGDTDLKAVRCQVYCTNATGTSNIISPINLETLVSNI